MERIAFAVGVCLLAGGVVAAGMYAWSGHWVPVLLALGAAVVGKMTLGIIEILLTPLSLPMLYFAKRGRIITSSVLSFLAGLIVKAAYSVYCIAVLLYYFNTPGPPRWLAVALAVSVSSAPFLWAAESAGEDTHPSHFDLIAAMSGVAISGALLVFKLNIILSLAPIAILFFLSTILLVYWWVTIGAPRIRLQHVLSGG